MKTTNILITIAAGLLLAGCVDELAMQDRTSPVRLCVSQDAGYDMTRTVSDLHSAATGFIANETMKVFMKNGATTTNGIYKVVAAGISSTLGPNSDDDALYYPSGTSGSVDLYAVYPAGIASGSTHTVAYDQTGDAAYRSSDLMYSAAKTVNLSDKGTQQSLNNFRHQMVRLKLNIVKDAGVASVTEVKMTNVKRQVTVSALSASGITVSAAASTNDANGDNIRIFSGSNTSTALQTYYVVFPKQVASGNDWNGTAFLTVTADGGSATYQLTKTFIAGYQYELTLNVNSTALGTTTTISDWDVKESEPALCVSAGGMTIDPISPVIYDGSAQTPALTVKVGGTTLTAGTDYDVAWSNNTNAGTATAIVTGKGTYADCMARANFGILDITMNPLWWVAEKNCGEGLTFVDEDNAVYLYTWDDAMSNFGVQTTTYDGWYAGDKIIRNANGTIADDTWHLPTRSEWLSIVPNTSNVWNVSGYKTDMGGVCFGYNAITKAGIDDHSYWVKESATVMKAIRFIGTDYCSVWKYELLGGWTSSDYGYLRISATLIGNVVTDSADGAAAWWTANGAGVTFGNTANGIRQQRVFYAQGYSTSAGEFCEGTNGHYCSSTESDDLRNWRMGFGSDDLYLAGRVRKNSGVSVRLFRDNSGFTSLPAGALPGKFQINSSGTQVYFSQGNLRATYNSSTWTWSFAENQWDYIGDGGSNTVGNEMVTSSSPYISGSGTVDLFGWVGASSTWTGVNKYGITSSTATNNTDGYGNSTSDALKADWGTLAISNGGNTTNSGWRTLTKDEWKYIFGTNDGDKRSGSTVNGTANVRYAHATINTDVGDGVNGMILFPDGVTIAADEATTWGTLNGNSSWGTKCTSAQWSALAAKGCVFLPAAGFRNEASVITAGMRGCYWSSSPNTSDAANAYLMFFYSNNLNPAYSGYRSQGNSVRLVRQVE